MYCTVMRVRVPLDSTDYETQRVHVPLGCVFADFRLSSPPPPRPPPTFTPIKPNNTDGVNYMYRCHRQRHRHSRQTATDCPHHRHARISSTISRTLKSDGSRQYEYAGDLRRPARRVRGMGTGDPGRHSRVRRGRGGWGGLFVCMRTAARRAGQSGRAARALLSVKSCGQWYSEGLVPPRSAPPS